MLKYKVALVTLLVGFFAVPSQVFPLTLQKIQSPIMIGNVHSCIVTNVGSDNPVEVTIQVTDTNGNITDGAGPNTVAPGASTISSATQNLTVRLLRRCSASWFGHRGDIIGEMCARLLDTGEGIIDNRCLTLQ